MKKLVALTLVSAVALAASPAVAAVPTGPRVEAIVGYDAPRVDLSDLGVDDKIKDEGVLYGVGAGFDFGLSNGAALGIDVEATDSTAKDSNAFGSIKTGRDLYAGGRVSLPIGANGSNVYAKGGYTNARFKASNGVVSDSTNLDGYRLGAGAQLGLNGKAYVGGEYRYSNYEEDVTRHQLALTVGTRF